MIDQAEVDHDAATSGKLPLRSIEPETEEFVAVAAFDSYVERVLMEIDRLSLEVAGAEAELARLSHEAATPDVLLPAGTSCSVGDLRALEESIERRRREQETELDLRRALAAERVARAYRASARSRSGESVEAFDSPSEVIDDAVDTPAVDATPAAPGRESGVNLLVPTGLAVAVSDESGVPRFLPLVIAAGSPLVVSALTGAVPGGGVAIPNLTGLSITPEPSSHGKRSGRGFRRLIHVDVLLPMLLAVIVLAVTLAWMGG